MKKYKPCILIALGLMLLQIFLGCGGRSPSSRFYTLNPVMRGDTGVAQRPVVVKMPTTIGIMPIEIPDYLDRPEIVTRNSFNGLSLAEYDRWGGDLRNDIARVLAETLSTSLPSNRVIILSGRRSAPANYQLTVQVRRFEPMPDGRVRLAAQWSITENPGQTVLFRSNSDVSENVSGPGYQAIVDAMSRAVERLGQEITVPLKPVLAGALDSNPVPERTATIR